MRIKHLAVAALITAPTLHAQIPPGIDPSQVVSGITSCGHYDVRTTDGQTHTGQIYDKSDSRGSGVIFTVPDNGPATTTLVHPGLSVTY